MCQNVSGSNSFITALLILPHTSALPTHCCLYISDVIELHMLHLVPIKRPGQILARLPHILLLICIWISPAVYASPPPSSSVLSRVTASAIPIPILPAGGRITPSTFPSERNLKILYVLLLRFHSKSYR